MGHVFKGGLLCPTQSFKLTKVRDLSLIKGRTGQVSSFTPTKRGQGRTIFRHAFKGGYVKCYPVLMRGGVLKYFPNL